MDTRELLILTALAALICACDSGEVAAASPQPVILGAEVVDPAEQNVEPEAVVAESEGTAESQPSADGESADSARPGPLSPGETGHYGAPFTIESQAMTLADAIEQCVGTDTPCLVSAEVAQVCQMSGCWFTVTSASVESVVRIRMLDYGFFVPRNALGASVTFEGVLSLKEVSQELAQHYADDEAAAGGEPREVDGPVQEYEIVITGAEMRASGS